MALSARRLVVSGFVSLSVLGGVLGLAGVSAQAAVTHNYLSQITEVPPGSGAPLTGLFSGVNSMTVDNGHLWVAEHPPINGVSESEDSSYRVDEFDAATGSFVSQLPQVSSLFYLYQGVAVSDATGNVYVGGERPGGSRQAEVAVFDPGANLLNIWNGSDIPAAGSREGFGEAACGSVPGGFGVNNSTVAVDNSTSLMDWATGDVYVATRKTVDILKPEADGKEKYVAQLTGIGSEPTSLEPTEAFQEPCKVAVDDINGDVIVADSETVDVFEPVALEHYAFVGQLTPASGSFGSISSVAVDDGSGEIYVGARKEEVVDEFSPAGVYLGQITGAGTPAGHFSAPLSVAVDSGSHHVYVGDAPIYAGESPFSNPSVIDVFGPDAVLPDVTTGSFSNLQATGATLSGTVNPAKSGPATCQFAWGTTTALEHTAPCSTPVAEGENPVPVQTTLSGLEPDTTYYYGLQARNASGENPGEASQVRSFKTPGPGLLAQSASTVTAESATLNATIDPDGSPTTYFFQYGTEATYGADLPVAPGAMVGSGHGETQVSQHPQGLRAHTVYHYRVVRVSELAPGEFEEFAGPDRTFTTQSTGGASQLLDGRAWEMVTPPEKHGALFEPLLIWAIQASAAGDAIVDEANQPTETEPQGYATEVSVLSTRGSAGWSSQDISPQHDKGTGAGIGFGSEYVGFSEDLSRGLVEPLGFFTALSPEATESTPYLRTDYQGNDVSRYCQESCFQALVTNNNTSPPGVSFGEESDHVCTPPMSTPCGAEVEGASRDLNYVVLQSKVPLLSGVGNGLYEWSGGRLAFVGNGTLGNRNHMFGLSSVRGAVSDDGSRVFFSGSSEGLSGLLMRDTAKSETVRLGEGAFLAASSDGSKSFFLKGGDLYEYDLNAPANKRLTDLTIDTNPGEPAEVAQVLGISEDGSYVYFAAAGALTPDSSPGQCVSAPSSSHRCNLYVRHDNTTTLIAALSAEDYPDWAQDAHLLARVSPDGRWLAFMSNRSLTGYDTSDAISERPDEEVYLYDAGAAKLVCASCDPTGARPVGIKYGEAETMVGTSGLWGKTDNVWVSANVPPWTSTSNFRSTLYQSRYLSDNGRLFFDSDEALVPQDVNGTQDVYEYEPAGVGDCGTSSLTFGASSDGCVGLISSGSSPEESAFLDASETGGDVFFLTEARLVSQDFDNALDVYDARECTADAPCLAVEAVAPPPCSTGDSCKSSPSPQPSIFGPSPSATFSGAGNVVDSVSKSVVAPRTLTRKQKLARALKGCEKKARKRRAVCERQARERYGTGKPRRVNLKRKVKG